MITIIKNTVNRMVVTLSELTTIEDAYYLMQLISNDTMESKVIRLGVDNSFNKVRFNMFNLDEVDVTLENLDGAMVNLNVGTYDYNIFETDSPTDNTITNLNRVESGLLLVKNEGNVLLSVGDGNITILDVDDSGETIITFK